MRRWWTASVDTPGRECVVCRHDSHSPDSAVGKVEAVAVGTVHWEGVEPVGMRVELVLELDRGVLSRSR